MADRSVFDDIVVVEIANGSIAASVAGMLLADNGARVLKAEPPAVGDQLRTWNPTGFLVWNRGKESIVVDLGTSEGRSEARSLASRADVVIDGLGPGSLDSYGLDYASLNSINERLIYCAIRGFDERGPYSHLQAYEGVVAAKVGVFNPGVWGFRESPIFLNVPVVSVSAAHLALGSLTAALIARESIGVGQRLDVSMYTANTSFDYGLTPAYQHRMRHNPADLNFPKSIGGSRGIIHACSADNRWFVFMNLLPYQSRAMVKALGLGRLLDDAKFTGMPYFASPYDAEEYELTVMEHIRQLPGDEVVSRTLASPDVAFEEIRSGTNALDHPQAIHNKCSVQVNDPELGPVRQVGPIAHFARTPSRIGRSAPRLGQNRLGTNPVTRARPGAPGPAGAERSSGAAPGAPPLAGLTILEAGYYFAMPYGLMLAASLGARVIKLEGPDGDPWRMLASSEAEVFSSQCLQGKESVAIDMKSKDGLEVLHRLASRSDAFVYSLRPDPATLGVGYDDLTKLNPEIVYVHRPGYGTSGPYGGRPMYAHTGDAVAGTYMRNCGYWLDPERCDGAGVLELKAIQVPRMATDRMYADGHGANGAFCMTMMALLAKKRFGIGQYVEGSMLNAAFYGMSDELVDYAQTPQFPRADPDQMGLNALYRLYRASDDWIFLAAPTEQGWRALAAACRRGDLAADVRFATHEARREHDPELVAEIGGEISKKSAARWEAELNHVGVGCAVASSVQPQGFTTLDDGLRKSNLTFEVEHPTLGAQVVPGPPAAFSLTPGRVSPGTVYGQNTVSVLQELGYTVKEIEDLLARGVAFSTKGDTASS